MTPKNRPDPEEQSKPEGETSHTIAGDGEDKHLITLATRQRGCQIGIDLKIEPVRPKRKPRGR